MTSSASPRLSRTRSGTRVTGGTSATCFGVGTDVRVVIAKDKLLELVKLATEIEKSSSNVIDYSMVSYSPTSIPARH